MVYRCCYCNSARHVGYECPKYNQATCLVCDRRYERKIGGNLNDRVGYCSDECRRERDHRRAVARWANRPPREVEDRPCDRCGETFTPTRSDARYCSGRCRVAAHRAGDSSATG